MRSANEAQTPEQAGTSQPAERHEVHLSKHDVSIASWRWAFFNLSSQNYERMQGTPFCHSLSGALERLYGDDKKGLSCGIVIPLKYFLFVRGYSLGLDAVKLLTNAELKDKITTALTVVGLIVIGGVAATTIKAPITWVYTAGDMTIAIQDILDKIMPNLMPLVVAVVSYLLIAKKGWSANKLLAGILAFAAVMVVLGIM